MKRLSYVISVLLAILMVFFLVACNANEEPVDSTTPETPENQETDDEVLIGVPVPQSGPGAYLGGYIFNAIELEANRINANGGILGKKIVLVSRDDELNAEKALTCCREFIEMGAQAIIGPAYTTSAIATKDVVTEAKIIQLLPNVTGTAALVDAPYTFRLQEAEAIRYPELARFVAGLGYKKVGILAVNDSTGEEFFLTMENYLNEKGVEVVAKEYFRIDDTDLTPNMLKLKQAGCDVVLVGTGNSTPCAYIAQANKALDWNVPLMALGGFEGYTFPELAGDAAIGAMFVTGYRGYLTNVDYSEMPAGYARHVQEMVEQYGWMTTDSGIRIIKSSPMAGDAMIWYARAVEAAGTFDSDAVRAVMETMIIDAEETASGTRLVGGEDHNTYREGSMHCYKWIKNAENMWCLEEVFLEK